MLRKMSFVITVSLLLAVGVFAQSTSTSTTAATSASTTTKKPPIFRPTKDQILQVQTMLKQKKLYDGEANGTYNDPTRTGIKSFQKDNGLKETGTLNRATLEKFGVELSEKQKLIPVSQNSFAAPAAEASGSKPAKTAATSSTSTSSKSATTPASADTPKKPAVFRATVDQIKTAQKMMKEKSMYAGEETGKLDDATRDGLRKFQEAGGVKATGTLNAMTLEKMGIPLTDKQKADAAMTAPKN